MEDFLEENLNREILKKFLIEDVLSKIKEIIEGLDEEMVLNETIKEGLGYYESIKVTFIFFKHL